MENRKILFTDLDGTLLSSDKSISAKNRVAIQEALAQGHYIAIATGRSVESGRKVAKDLGLILPGCYMVAFNGAVLYDCAADRVLFEKTLPIEHVNTLFDKANEAGIYVHTYSKSEVITQQHTKELDYYCQRAKMKYRLVADIKSALSIEPNKVLLISLDDKEKLLHFQKSNMDWEKGKVVSFFSCDEYLEYCPLDTTKGKGIDYLCHFLDIPLENTIAVGDERNDISMIQKAKIGIAMKNAHQQLKDVADAVTQGTNDEDGIAEIIYKYLIN